jgi:hypothetical protein
MGIEYKSDVQLQNEGWAVIEDKINQFSNLVVGSRVIGIYAQQQEAQAKLIRLENGEGRPPTIGYDLSSEKIDENGEYFDYLPYDREIFRYRLAKVRLVGQSVCGLYEEQS